MGYNEEKQLEAIIQRLHNLTVDVMGFDGVSGVGHRKLELHDVVFEVGETLSDCRRRLDVVLREMRKARA